MTKRISNGKDDDIKDDMDMMHPSPSCVFMLIAIDVK